MILSLPSTALIGMVVYASVPAAAADDQGVKFESLRNGPFYERVDKGTEFNYNPPQSIIGGDEIVPYSRPYLVSLGEGKSGFFGQFCAGSLISPHAVLTAAHCVLYYGYWMPPEWVEFNRHDLFNDTNVVRMYLDTSQCDGDLIYHPDWDWSTDDNDVAILFLPTAVTDIAPVTLNDDPKIPVSGAPLDVAGWGLTEYGYPDVPLAATVNYVTNEACTRKPYRYKDELILDSMMCAAAPGKDSCYGDSGGPIVMGDEEPQGGPLKPVIQVGVVSWGTGCAEPSFPGVYTRVSEFTDWIKDTVCERTGELCHHSKASKNSKKKGENNGCVKVPTFAPVAPSPTFPPTITAQPTTPRPTYAPTITAPPFTYFPTTDLSPWPTWVPTQAPMSKSGKV